jgi:argininosuccinate synthase
MKKIVLAYTGGVDTSVAIAWLAEQYQAEVIAVTLDLGQGRELTDVRERALAVGAARAHVLDAREEFAREYILPALQAEALYEDLYPLATALGRPLIAKKLVEIAHMEGATAIAHGCNGKANDELRLTLGIRALDASLGVLGPARMWGMSRKQEFDYARARHIPITGAVESPYSVDANLWGRSIERGGLEDPWQESPEEIYTLTRSPQDCPNEPAYVEVEFENGAPVRANGIEMPLVELIESLETIAGAHGVGRIDMVENATTGAKSREIYEAPAAVVLHTAHNELQKLVIPRDLERIAHDLARTYADLVYNGHWFSPTRGAIDGFVRAFQPRVTGAVRLKLFKGDCRVVGRRSVFNAADPSTASVHSAAETK